MSFVNFQGQDEACFINTEFSSHIIFVSAFPCFARSRGVLDETHIRVCEYGFFAGFN
jgi:hypothetical protein